PMPEAPRIDVEEARRKVESGATLLVCAYDDEEKCRKLALEGSITLQELETRRPGRDQEIIFYCA
ncbi:MAG TPA: ArsR family transcriptional regulator, partial [Thermoanaerobaculia bacterium]|nr:ArsR family transcriptional regulator [Thermoanaerobaculia bacterium]